MIVMNMNMPTNQPAPPPRPSHEHPKSPPSFQGFAAGRPGPTFRLVTGPANEASISGLLQSLSSPTRDLRSQSDWSLGSQLGLVVSSFGDRGTLGALGSQATCCSQVSHSYPTRQAHWLTRRAPGEALGALDTPDTHRRAGSVLTAPHTKNGGSWVRPCSLARRHGAPSHPSAPGTANLFPTSEPLYLLFPPPETPFPHLFSWITPLIL